MQDRLQFATDIARQAGGLLREGYGHVTEVGLKGAVDLVTEHDLASERLIVEALEKAFPDDGIVAEEGSSAQGDDYRWYIDPLDGTTNYAHGLPIFSVSIACVRGAEDLVLGVIYDPMLDEMFTAEAGAGAELNGQPLTVSAEDDLAESLLVTGFPYDIRTNSDNNLDHFANFAVSSRAVRRLGSAAIDLAYVACGRFDGYWELRLNPWDWAAGVLMVREAGGLATTFDGGDKVLAGHETLVASNGHIHQRMLATLNHN